MSLIVPARKSIGLRKRCINSRKAEQYVKWNTARVGGLVNGFDYRILEAQVLEAWGLATSIEGPGLALLGDRVDLAEQLFKTRVLVEFPAI